MSPQHTHITPGCYVDGHWGHYATARMIDVAYELGARWDTFHDDRHAAERYLSTMMPNGVDIDDDDMMILSEIIVDAADAAEEALNNYLPDDMTAHWHDGEFFVSPWCDNNDDCTDETCAHWEV